MLIYLITHCYAETLPQYAALLRYQLSGLALHPPTKATVGVIVCYTGTDTATKAVLDNSPYDHMIPLSMPIEKLGRRAIGRNLAARANFATKVIFTDVDYVWHGDAFDTLAAMRWPPATSMIYPRNIQISRDHDVGDRQWGLAADYGLSSSSSSSSHSASGLDAGISSLSKQGCVDINLADFVDKHYNRAIGGCQIVTGEFASRHGYLSDDPKWQTPHTAAPFSNFSDDVAYRSFCKQHGQIVAVDLPGIYRIRHGQKTY